jgi:hypothetical protein
MRVAVADGAGDDGMRRDGAREGAGEEVRVSELGMLAMTAEMTDSGDTPSVADVQPETAKERTAATAPTRESERVVMARAKAAGGPDRARAQIVGAEGFSKIEMVATVFAGGHLYVQNHPLG